MKHENYSNSTAQVLRNLFLFSEAERKPVQRPQWRIDQEKPGPVKHTRYYPDDGDGALVVSCFRFFD